MFEVRHDNESAAAYCVVNDVLRSAWQLNPVAIIPHKEALVEDALLADRVKLDCVFGSIISSSVLGDFSLSACCEEPREIVRAVLEDGWEVSLRL